MLNFTIYTADCVGNSGNCLYPNKMIVTDKESFIKYKGNYRSKDNFEFSDCIPLDCDNDHSDDPNEWVTPLDIALEIPGVAFAVSYSRHHNLPKGDKPARPRFHIFFPIEIVFGGGAISTESSYDVKYTITDAFTTVTIYDTVSTAAVLMDFKAGGKGIAIGKVAEKDNVVEIANNWELEIHGKKLIDYIYPIGTVFLFCKIRS